MALEAGSRLGPYEIVGLVGSGGMGEVYRARDPRLGREVAIKVLPEGVVGPPRLRRFEQEARAAGSLNHPNILAVHDVGTHEGGPFVVSELLEGQTLRARLEGGALPARKAVEYALQIARGLAAAHGKGIVHRDLKPENVFVTEDGRVKILDFGLAKLTGSGPLAGGGERGETQSTESGTVLGTVGYMSPEQVRGESVDSRSDIFSFGAVLYEMLTGSRAFRRDSAAETMTAILKEDPPELIGTGGAIPSALAGIVGRCLEKRPEDRFHSTHDLALALEVASSGELRATVVERRGATVAPAIERTTGLKKATLATLAAVATAAVGVSWALLHAPEPTPGEAIDSTEPFEITPFTSDGGYKTEPQLSPDGEKVVYGWGGAAHDNFDIYVKALGVGARALRLTDHPAYEGGAVWSPDERQIAFLRATNNGAGAAIYVVPSMGGQERKLIDISGLLRTFSQHWVPNLSWSPDGDWLALGEKATADEPARLVRLSMATLEKQPLTTPPRGSGGAFEPSISPDGTQLAFVRFGSAGDLDVWVQPVEGGEARRVTFGEYARCREIAWTADGGDLLFTAGTSGSVRILRVSLAGGRPQPIPGVGEGVMNASVSGDRMVYQQVTKQPTDIWRVPGRGAASADRAPERLISSSRDDGSPAYSPDGRKIAFCSNRRGAWDVWVSDSDGSDPVQLTDLAGMTGSPRWSPNSRQIVFDNREPEGGNHLYVIDAEGGVPRRLTQGTSGNGFGSWSRDGEWIYFGSQRSPGDLEDSSRGRRGHPGHAGWRHAAPGVVGRPAHLLLQPGHQLVSRPRLRLADSGGGWKGDRGRARNHDQGMDSLPERSLLRDPRGDQGFWHPGVHDSIPGLRVG